MKKIMFNDKYRLTQAVLDGRKTMTRRIVKGQLPLGNLEETEKYAPYQVGEIVAIAQSYNKIGLSPLMQCEVPNEYGGTRDGSFYELAGWTNKLFVKAELMPHHIKITNIRVERLQDISDEDCLREGVFEKKLKYTPFGYNPNRMYYTFDCIGYCFNDARDAFAALIEKVSGKDTWNRNPLVWVYEFCLVD